MTMLKQIEHETPRGLRCFNPAIPTDLENIILKAISKNREDRYVSAEEFAADIKRFLGGQSPLARRPTLLDHSARWIRRHAKGVAVAGAVCAVLLAVSVITTLMVQSKNREIAAAQAQSENHLLRANAAVHQFGHALLVRLELLPGSEQVRIETARDALAYFRAFAAYAHDRSLMQTEVARSLMICGDLELQIGEVAAAADHYRQAHDLWARIESSDRTAQQLLCQNNLATALARLGKLEEARQVMQTALKSQRASATSSAATSLAATSAATSAATIASAMALLHMNLGHVLTELDETRAASDEFAKALQMLDEAQGRDHVITTASSNQLQKQLSALMATALVQSGELTEEVSLARELIERAVAVQQARVQADASDIVASHDLAMARLALGANWLAQSDREAAERLFQKAANDLKRLSDEHPAIVRFSVDLASARNNIGQVELEDGKFSAAERSFLESKSLLERLVPSSQDYWVASNLGGVCNNLAVVKEHQGDFAQAEQLLNTAIEYQEAALAKAPDSSRCREFLAEHRAQLARLTHQSSPHN
jgi:tetratricopeptide (TPR) repeat protein